VRGLLCNQDREPVFQVLNGIFYTFFSLDYSLCGVSGGVWHNKDYMGILSIKKASHYFIETICSNQFFRSLNRKKPDMQ